MPRCRIRKTARGMIDTDIYKQAAEQHLTYNVSVRTAAKTFSLCHVTLSRFIKKMQSGETSPKVGYRSAKRIFSDEEETIFKDYLLSENLYYGLWPKEVRRLAYEMAMKHKKEVPEGWHKNEMAGIEWCSSFMKRHPVLSQPNPEVTSVAGATSVNETRVSKFFNNLANVKQESPQLKSLIKLLLRRV